MIPSCPRKEVTDMEYFNAFLCGGILCLIGQLLIDKTPLTPAKILVLYVVTGVVLGGAGVYQKLVDWAGSLEPPSPSPVSAICWPRGCARQWRSRASWGPSPGCHRSGGRHQPPPSSSASWWRCSSSPSPRADSPLWELFSSEQDFSGFFSTCVLHWARGDKHGAAI